MNKHMEIFESTQKEQIWEYSDKLCSYIEKNIKIPGYSIDYDARSGSLSVISTDFSAKDSDIQMYCTPLFDGEESITISAVNTSGDEVVEPTSVKFKPTMDLRKDAEEWKKIVVPHVKKIFN